MEWKSNKGGILFALDAPSLPLLSLQVLQHLEQALQEVLLINSEGRVDKNAENMVFCHFTLWPFHPSIVFFQGKFNFTKISSKFDSILVFVHLHWWVSISVSQYLYYFKSSYFNLCHYNLFMIKSLIWYLTIFPGPLAFPTFRRTIPHLSLQTSSLKNCRHNL